MLEKTVHVQPDLRHGAVDRPKDVTAHFDLRYGDLMIGELWLYRNVWHYAYTAQFKGQNAVKPLTDFPAVNKTYKSEALWPFFALRIPSLQQPAIQRIVDEEELDSRNQVDMLARFARRTISNPFELELQ